MLKSSSLDNCNVTDDEIIADIINFIENDPVNKELTAELAVEEYLKTCRQKKKRKRYKNVDVWSTSWGFLLCSETVEDCTSRDGKLFRRRFRIDYESFRDILVPWCSDPRSI